jgi:hypothetical protein
VKVASLLFADACSEAAALSFAVGVEHLVLACARAGALDVDPDAVRERILEEQRTAFATFGISFDSVRERVPSDAPCLPVRPEAKRMLDLATKRRRRELTAEELLATLREHSTTAQRLLRELDEAR